LTLSSEGFVKFGDQLRPETKKSRRPNGVVVVESRRRTPRLPQAVDPTATVGTKENKMKKSKCLLCDSFEGLFGFEERDLVLDLEENGDCNGGIWGDYWEKW
jgi:hypothetical protein